MELLLPADAVLTGAQIDGYKPNCLGLSRVIPAVLLASNEEHVVGIVQIAGRHRVPIYAISTGHNWGYGSSLPAVDGCVILDLSRMNRILRMDAELGLITLEPGVTQKQLSDYLKSGGFNFFVPTTGAGPTASIVGNALERGFGMTPEKDHFTAVTSVRAVLPNGAVYQPYLSEIGAPVADGVYKWGIGPYLDGLFTQGCFGVVTSLQISLVRRPEHIEVFVFTQKDAAQFPRLVETCRELFHDLRGPIGSVKFINQRQVELTIGTRELGVSLKADFAWMGFGVIHCKRSMIRSLRAAVRQALLPHTSRLVFFNEGRLRLLKRVSRLLPSWLNGMLAQPVDRFQHLLEIVNGVPRALELRLAYQYVPFNPDKESLDPARDGVGILWYAPVIPLKSDTVRRMIGMIGETLEKHSFPPAMSITTLSEKCGMGVIPIIYQAPEEKERAHLCFRELWRRGVEIGCHPYRINIAAMPEMTEGRDSTFWAMVADLKAAIDPDGILSPGRYTPTH
jgi:FAD/FMN-containing dehydrogenase